MFPTLILPKIRYRTEQYYLATIIGWCLAGWTHHLGCRRYTIHSDYRLLWRLFGLQRSGPTIDIDIDNILGCDDTTIGCEGGCSQAHDGKITLRLPAGRVFGFLLLISVVLIRRREPEPTR